MGYVAVVKVSSNLHLRCLGEMEFLVKDYLRDLLFCSSPVWRLEGPYVPGFLDGWIVQMHDVPLLSDRFMQ